jgi:hypothetical protein
LSNLEGHEASQRRIQFPPQPANPDLYELVQVTTKGDQRDSWREETIISVHRTELGAYKAGLKSGFVVRPLKVAD